MGLLEGSPTQHGIEGIPLDAFLFQQHTLTDFVILNTNHRTDVRNKITVKNNDATCKHVIVSVLALRG